MSAEKKFITRWSRDFQGNLQEDPNGSWVLATDAAIRDKRMMDKIDALQALLTAADERADVLENALRELLSGTGRSPGANKKYGKARAVLEGLGKKEDSRICTPAKPHNYHLGECTKCGAISPTE